ncbi:MAG: hypothetical protein ABSF78_12975 [Candidatus Acidiferrales bacterium]
MKIAGRVVATDNGGQIEMKRPSIIACAAAITLFCGFGTSARPAPAAADTLSPAILDSGFAELYKLNFQGARAEFLSYEKQQPGDPLGKVAEAASYLYEEFNEKGVFTSAFFLDDAKFLGGVDGKPSENRNDAFMGVNQQAREMAQGLLKENPRDAHGLLVLTMADGMESDYDALIEKKQLAGLTMMRRADSEASLLLSIDPNAQDAYLALGASNYVIGSLPGYKRIFLKIGGVHGDKERGIELMQQAADHGHYLKPFAQILLALGYEREHRFDRARVLLTDLTVEFPENPLFAHELSLIQTDPPRKR